MRGYSGENNLRVSVFIRIPLSLSFFSVSLRLRAPVLKIIHPQIYAWDTLYRRPKHKIAKCVKIEERTLEVIMRKLIVFIGLALLFLPVVGVQAQDDDSPLGGVIYGLISENNAYVRVGPDFAYRTIGQLPLNASVVVAGRAGDFYRSWDGRQWLEIDFGSRRGWVYARLVRTSVAFNSIFPTGRLLPRNNDGRVPEVFDLSANICDRWRGGFTRSGDFLAGGAELTVTYPEMPGANVYSVITISPSGFRTAFDSVTTTATIDLRHLPRERGTYTWRVAPYWTNSTVRYRRQQLCLLRTGGTFEKP